MTCPTPQQLLEYAEGGTLPDVATHVATCVTCHTQLAELGAFETMLATRERLPADERGRLRAATERALQAGAAPAARTRRFALWPALGIAALAAAVLAATTFWPSPHGLTDLDVRCYPVDGDLRAERSERFAVSLRVADPRWIAIWQLGDARGKRLLPDPGAPLPTFGVTFPLAPGDHRIPASELLDFEHPISEAPRRLVVIATSYELSAAQLAELDTMLAGGEPSAVAQRYPEARVVTFPPR